MRSPMRRVITSGSTSIPSVRRRRRFGGTIAHGLYTLSLGPRFSYAMFEISGVAFGIDYGYDKVRFPAPLPVGSRVRMRATARCSGRAGERPWRPIIAAAETPRQSWFVVGWSRRHHRAWRGDRPLPFGGSRSCAASA
jgi:hypothetical protein